MRIGVRHAFHLNCDETAQLISLGRDHRLSLWRKLQIRIHNAACEACRGYLAFVRGVGKKLREDLTTENMPEEIRRTLKDKIKIS